MTWESVGYATLCVVVPVVWGVIVVWMSNWIERHLGGSHRGSDRQRKRRPPRPIEYHI